MRKALKAIQGAGTSITELAIRRSLAGFSAWFNAWRHEHPCPLLQSFRTGLLPGDFAATLVKEDLKVGIAGLNSIFRNVTTGNAPGSHEVDVEQLEAAMPEGTRTWAREHDVLLLLTHHSPSELQPKPLEQLLNAVTPPEGFTLHLCGSRGVTALNPLKASKKVLAVQTPSLFGLENEDDLPLKHWGYITGEVELGGSPGKGQVRLFPRAATPTATGSVMLLPENELKLDEDESLVIPITTLLGESEAAIPPPAAVPQAADAPPVSAMALETFSAPETPDVRAPWATDAGADLKPTRNTKLKQDLPPGVRFLELLYDERGSVRRMAWSPVGDALAVGFSDGRIACWSSEENSLRWEQQAHPVEVLDLCFSPNGQKLVSCSQEAIRFWRAADGSTHPGLTSYIRHQSTCLAWSSQSILATVSTEDGSIELWNTMAFSPHVISLDTIGHKIHRTGVYRLAWDSSGVTLACCGVGDDELLLCSPTQIQRTIITQNLAPSIEARSAILDIAWKPNSTHIAMACEDKTVRVWDTQAAISVAVLEGHTNAVTGVAFSFDGRLLASKSFDGSVRLFRTDTWEEVARFEEPASRMTHGGLAFAPKKHVLASLGLGGRAVRLWDIDIEILLSTRKPATTVHAASAKIVLVGEGRAGKSSLASRMATDRYEEMESTHGMRFWTLPAEHSGPGRGSTSRTHREIILWDMGGQEEYRLVHQLFLRDSTVALMVMEPGRGRVALDELEGWNQRLLTHTGERNVRKLLVGTKVDNEHSPVDPQALQHFVKAHQFEELVLTSARTGRGIVELKSALARAIDWNALEKVIRPELFQRLRQHIQRLKEAKRVVLTFTELEDELRRDVKDGCEPEALQAVVAQLARQGLVADTRMADGTRALILEVEQVERYAGSLILAARDNPHQVPAIDVAKVQSPAMRFPRISAKERLRRDQELIVLDCVIQLLLEHGLCLQHEGLLIFPSLFRPTQSETGTDLPHAISLHYDFSGPIDNIYASLVTSLAVSKHFGAVRLWESRAEFGRAGENTSGIRRVQQAGQGARGQAQLDVYFDANTPQPTRELFVSFVEEHLRERGVRLLERMVVTCVCGRVFPEDMVQARIAAEKPDIICPVCEHRTPLTLGAQQAKERNPEIARQILALRTNIQELRAQSIVEAKVSMTEAKRVEPKPSTPLRILHLSDLHVGTGADPLNLLQPLVDDLNDATEGLGVERLDYLVISGDITNRATPQEFEKAHAFVSELIPRLGLTAERCIIVPGNHDLHWDTEVYTFKKKRQVAANELVEGRYQPQGDAYLIRDDAKYPERFRNFSEHFYHPLFQKEYPLLPEQQCIPTLFSDTRLQFLAMNSAWEIDEYFRERSSIHESALSRGLTAATEQVDSAIKTGALASEAEVLRICVWHHPITGNEKIRADAFVSKLTQMGVRFCMHGHVHEDRADLLNYLHQTRKLYVVGAGSFGAPTVERPESVPRLYNLLEVERDHSRIRVHTRCLRREGGAWEGWAVWPGGPAKSKLTYYDIPLR